MLGSFSGEPADWHGTKRRGGDQIDAQECWSEVESGTLKLVWPSYYFRASGWDKLEPVNYSTTV